MLKMQSTLVLRIDSMRILKAGVVLLFLGLFALLIYNLPPVRERLDWRLIELRAQIKYAISPPSESVFIPQEQSSYEKMAFVSPSPTSIPSSTPTPTKEVQSLASPSPFPSLTPTLSPTTLPERVVLTGVKHEYQTWNNCGPANLSMALSFWNWQGTQQEIANFTKPNPRDKNVMPYEMAAFVEEMSDFNVVVRVGGSIEIIKSFLAAGFPVILEKGFEGAGFDSWMGHYVTVTGYDDTREQFIVQDSYIMPDMTVSYGQVESFWRAFNFTYLVIYPPDRESEVLAILGKQSNEEKKYQSALAIASNEINALSGRDQFFAWFNRGTNLVALQDYTGAAEAYDEAFGLYATLSEDERPWRMMWYQTAPYWAYFYTSRYYDVINLATTTLDAMSEPVLEESYYWRGLAREALGDQTGAIDDLQRSLEVHPGYEPSLFQLERLGVNR
jgi:hypothetical protein